MDTDRVDRYINEAFQEGYKGTSAIQLYVHSRLFSVHATEKEIEMAMAYVYGACETVPDTPSPTPAEEPLTPPIPIPLDATPVTPVTDPVERVKSCFECPITLQLMRHPRITPCGHTFEEDYLDQLIARQTYVCPICRAPLPRGVVFPKNYALQEAVKILYPQDAEPRTPPQERRPVVEPPAPKRRRQGVQERVPISEYARERDQSIDDYNDNQRTMAEMLERARQFRQ